MANPERTVIIAGGSVTGLALANMLERVGIRYFVLEANDEIAPQVGACIGLQANGLRILDQLGCADDILSLVDMPLRDCFLRDTDGSAIVHYWDFYEMIIKRYGYPITFIDRQMLLQALYNNLESKDSVLTGRRVQSVTKMDDAVEIVTSKGEVFRGDILIGADGIYSGVRKEMWRLGNELSPGYFPVDEWSGKVFPLPSNLPGLHSYFVISGPGGRVYWFLFDRLPVPLFGRDIPTYTKTDEEALAQQHLSDAITTSVCFGQLYEARTKSVLTPLHEYVFQRWHFGRIMTLGDATHKFAPSTGQGGNAAIVSAAALMNRLTSSDFTWSDSDVNAAFSSTQEERIKRVSDLVTVAHLSQQRDAMATPLLGVMARTLPRFLDVEIFLDVSFWKLTDSTRLKMLPMLVREHTIPFKDELPAEPLPLPWLPAALGLLFQGALYRLSSSLLPPLEAPVSFNGAPLRQRYCGIEPVDKILSIMVSVFGVVVAGNNLAAKTQLLCFAPLLLSTALDWTIQSHRVGRRWLPTSFPSVFGAMYQLLGIGKIAPLYHLISVVEDVFYQSLSAVSGQRFPREVASALIPAVTLGYILPTALMLCPFENKDTWQKFVALWQPFPIYVGLLTAGLSRLSRKGEATGAADQKRPQEKQREVKATQSTLRSVYMVGTAAATLFHLWAMYGIWSSSELSVTGVFGELCTLLSGSQASNPGDNIFRFFQRDMLLNAASVLAHSIYRIVHLRSSGYITTREAATASLVTCVAQPVIGPAAAHVGFCGWREEIFMRVGRRMSPQT
ncbi:hypothetical protein FZEAL_9449 [Fusarium zealandicum]|uniref:FAD-binding domain-containing protein n=1 Tax=Fusarium zealandicum TaxID=1053134 RepID=A0A8H4UB58_9HYPO|nr:hypothetical protein FZEAL_9449 [Fusarium zealandicum]